MTKKHYKISSPTLDLEIVLKLESGSKAFKIARSIAESNPPHNVEVYLMKTEKLASFSTPKK